MTGAAPKLKRPLYYAERGTDVRVVQRALHRALGARARNSKNGSYGDATVGDMIRFQKREGIVPASGNMGRASWERLWRWVNTPDARLYGGFVVPPDLTPLEVVQQEIVRAAFWMVAHAGTFRYREVRPIPYRKIDVWDPNIDTDCSGSVSMCYRAGGAPDPNGFDYSGSGFTGSLRAHGRVVPLDQLQPADMLHYRSPQHVAMVLDPATDTNFTFGHWPPQTARKRYRSDLEFAMRYELVAT